MYKLKSIFIRTFLSLILLMLITFLINNDIHSKLVDKIIFENNIDFSYIRSKTNKLFKNIINKDSYVTSEKLEYSEVIPIGDSFKFITSYNYLIKSLSNGTVVYIGNKDDLDNTIIIEGDNSIYYWYSNIENISVNLYDYVDKNVIIGSTIDNYFYLTLKKDDKYLNYEKYI